MGESGDEEVRSGGRKVVDINLDKLSKLKKHQQFNNISDFLVQCTTGFR